MTRSSPLRSLHEGLGAKLINFGGWDMPLQYPSGVIQEHRAVRERVGLFDVSHLGKLTVTGDGAEQFLDSVLPRRVSRLKPGRAGYNLLLNNAGGIVDDIFVYRLQDSFIVVPNASNTDAVLDALAGRAEEGVVQDARERWAILALSGPKARHLLETLAPEATGLKLHQFTPVTIGGTRVTVARTGYTGEFTAEFFVDWDQAEHVWNQIMGAGDIAPAGLGCRDTLRLEMGYPLHGNDISPDINPLEAGMGWLIDWERNFIGSDALEKIRSEGQQRALVGLVAKGREIPRSHYPILKDGEKVGEVTSGNFSPSLGRGIALGYVRPSLAEPGTELTVEVRSKTLVMEVTNPPFIGKA